MTYSKDIIQIIADRYNEQELMKAQDVIGDVADELRDAGETEKARVCDEVFEVLSSAINRI